MPSLTETLAVIVVVLSYCILYATCGAVRG